MSLVPIVFLFSSLFALALSQCVLPPVPAGITPVAFVKEEFNGQVMFSCPTNHIATGNMGADGPIIIEALGYICDPADGKLRTDGEDKETALTTATCRPFPDTATMCMFLLNDVTLILEDGQSDFKCPAGFGIEMLPTGEIAPSMRCANTNLMASLNGNTEQKVGDQTNLRSIACKKVPTTTSTTTTTTTKKPDSPASASHLWNVNYYYNYGYGVHAFCADQACINAIQSNGIGYDMNNGKGLMGKAVSESAINAVRASCPTGSQSLRNLGFTKYGNKYGHNLNGSGIKQGWVSISRGACGATVGIKRWKSRYTDDMMYGVDLEWNTWYQGMVQEGGQVHFYMWN